MSRVFFTDRDLGKQFPALLQEAGILVERHGDHFAANAPDDEWLPRVGAKGWIVLTHDQRIRYKVNERDAVMANGVRMFVMIGKAAHAELARSFVTTIARVEQFLEGNQSPFIAKIYRGTLEAKSNRVLPGRVEPWLTFEDWQRSRGEHR